MAYAETQPHWDMSPVEELLVSSFSRSLKSHRRTLGKQLVRKAKKMELTYLRTAGSEAFLPLTLVPLVVHERQARRLQRLALACRQAMVRLMGSYPEDRRLQTLLPFTEPEHRLLREVWSASHARRQTLIARLDLDCGTREPSLARDAQCYEVNGVAVGGLFYSPVGEVLLGKSVLPLLDLPPLGRLLWRQGDTRRLVLAQCLAHARKLGCSTCRIGLVEDKSWDVGITEYPSQTRCFRKWGVEAYLVDPRQLTLRRGEICYRGRPLDVLYRNFELKDWIEWEEEEGRWPGLVESFRQNRMVSGLAGELDHKSLFEVLAHRRFRSYYSSAQWALFRRHIPWTRLLFPRKTTVLPAPGKRGEGPRRDLAPFVRRHRERLVIKPNRESGGVGVKFGYRLGARAWERVLERALHEEGDWVVQALIPGHRKRVPILGVDGRVVVKRCYTSYGMAMMEHDCAIVGRVCPHRIVNVSCGGALAPIFQFRE